MKNTKLYPFERNKYFYGKLLSVEDFNAEQKYINDKRRLINRLVHGAGVVSGLNIVCIDDNTISVDSGLAFDNTGREIVIDAPIIKKLSLINGYENACGEGSGAYVYLCLEYSEAETSPTHNIAAQGGNDRIAESYNLYLTSEEPGDDIENDKNLFERRTTVFRDKNICIKHIMPRFVHPGERFELRVEIESYAKQYTAFSYDIQLVCLNTAPENSSVVHVNFDESLFEKTGRYMLAYSLSASDVSDTSGEARIDGSTFTLSYDRLPAEIGADNMIDGNCAVEITANDIADEVARSCYRSGMDLVMRNTAAQKLYLARIDLVNAGGALIIEDVENVPFGQYVKSLPLLSSLSGFMGKSGILGISGISAADNRGSGFAEKSPKRSDPDISSGVCRIDLNAGGLRNKTFCSDEIVHGLGPGNVTIVLGLPTAGNEIVYGSSEVFKDDVINVETAAKLSASNGSFVIGVMLRSTVAADYIDIKWTAVREAEESEPEKSRMHLTIKPGSLVLKPRESRYLEAVCKNMTNKNVRWSVVSEYGGEIDANGMYVAPNTEGIYEIMAQSVLYPEIKASVMVVVRE